MSNQPEPNRVDEFRKMITRSQPYFAKLWAHRKEFFIANVAILLLCLSTLLFIVKPYYESTITILPEYGNKSTQSGLSEIAAVAGVRLGSASPTVIYEDIIHSEAVIGPIIYAKYRTAAYVDSVNLLQYFHDEASKRNAGETEIRKVFLKAYTHVLESCVVTDVDQATEILTIRVRMPESKLSADLANNIVNSLDSYIRTSRKSYASNQRFYLEKRVSEVGDSLRQSEESLRDFNTANRVISQSPELTLQQSRLSRKVDIFQSVFVQLNQQLELAKIDEIRDTPVLNVKEFVADPVLKAGPGRIRIFLIIELFFFTLSTSYFIFSDELRKYWSIVKEGLRL